MKIKVDGCFLRPARIIAGIKGSFDVTYLEMCFGKDWEAFDKSVVFQTSSGTSVTALCEDGRVRIPDEVMMTHGKSSFAVVGRAGSARKTTLSGELYVLNTVDGEGRI
ncbi:MAG: hypothetical protein E7653_05805 [Ruminococcaceae bacterium]|nr:hypothetical protein [Oscillospiraceae bacterium]